MALQGCFEVTAWEALCETNGEDIDELTECIYIDFCRLYFTIWNCLVLLNTINHEFKD